MFSPDGRRIAYGWQKKPDGWPDRTRLAVMDLATGAHTVLTEPFDHTAADWSWMPDGRALLFHAEVRGRTNLFALPAAGGAPREVLCGGTTAGAEADAWRRRRLPASLGECAAGDRRRANGRQRLP